ncbi:MAG: hypothetical protein AAGF11_30045 [Myxococcota bacterium]
MCSLGPLRGSEVRELAVARDDLSEVDRPGVVIEEQLLHSGQDAPKILLFGSRGSGKSTELSRLERRWNTRHLVVGLPVDLNQVRREDLVIEELLALIAMALVRAASYTWGLELEAQAKALERTMEPLLPREVAAKLKVSNLLAGLVLFGTNLSDPTAAVGSAAKDLLDTAKNAVPLDVDVGGWIRRSKTRGPGDEIAGIIGEIAARIATEGRRPLVLLDGLDKIEGDHVDTVFDLLSGHGLLASLPFPIIVTAPVHLAQDYRARPLRNLGYAESYLYDVCIDDPNTPGSPLEEGRDKLRQALDRRLEAAAKNSETRVDDLLEPDAKEHLIATGGGSIRDTIQLLQTAALRAGFSNVPRIGPTQASEAVQRLRRSFEVGLTDSRREILRSVATSGALPDHEQCFTLLDRGLIRVYAHGGQLTYRPHSVLTEVLGGR